jgi:hypothetical protein
MGDIMSNGEREPWVDILWEKHEAYRYTPEVVMVQLGDRAVSLAIPEYVPRFTVSAWSQQGDLLFLMVQLEVKYSGEYGGGMIVARRKTETVYATNIWHELHSRTLRELGLTHN